MIIGYCVEGTCDAGLVAGLRDRWCPGAELREGSFRGSSGLSLWREIPKIVQELEIKGAEVIIFLTDSNSQNWHDHDNPEWRARAREQERKIPPGKELWIASGVADRNIECWLSADIEYAAKKLGVDAKLLTKAADPKGFIEGALRRDDPHGDKERERVADFVRHAPLPKWIAKSASFAAFHDRVRVIAKARGCDVPNERDRNE